MHQLVRIGVDSLEMVSSQKF